MVEADFARGAQRGGDMAMRQAVGDGEGILPGGDDGAALEHPPQAFDVRGRPGGEVAQRAFADLALVAVALAQQDRGRGVPVRDGFDVHGPSRVDLAARYKSQMRYYMATNLDGLGWFFQDFRQFIVTASRKLGLRISRRSKHRRRILRTATRPILAHPLQPRLRKVRSTSTRPLLSQTPSRRCARRDEYDI